MIAVNYAPITRCTDDRWRSSWNSFPRDGIGEHEVRILEEEGLVEVARAVAIVTDKGRFVLQQHDIQGPLPATPAMHAGREAHFSLQ